MGAEKDYDWGLTPEEQARISEYFSTSVSVTIPLDLAKKGTS